MLGSSRAEDGLDLLRVDDTGDIGVGDAAGGQEVVLLEGGGLSGGTVEGVELLKGALSPDDKATEVTTGSQSEQVQAADIAELNTGNVTEGLDNTIVLLEDDEGTTTLTEATVTHLSLTGTESAGILDTLDIGKGGNLLEDLDGLLGLLAGLSLVGEDEGELGDLLDAVTTGKDEGGEGRGSQGTDNSVTTLVDRHLTMPAAPDLGGCKHTTTTTHITKGTLSGTTSTTTTNTGDTGNGTTGTPGLGRGLVTSLVTDSVGLTAVLGQVGVDEVDDVRADGGAEDLGEGNGGLQGRTISRVNRDNRARGLLRRMSLVYVRMIHMWNGWIDDQYGQDHPIQDGWMVVPL